MTQLSLKFDPPKLLVKTVSKYNNLVKKLQKAESRLKFYETTALNAKQELQKFEKTYLVECGLALENELLARHRGWCPICKKDVEAKKYSYVLTSVTIHHPFMSGREYSGDREAHDETRIYLWRAPAHDKHDECDIKQLKHMYPYHGGTILNAPEIYWTTYGIPQPTEEQKKLIDVWDFVEHNSNI